MKLLRMIAMLSLPQWLPALNGCAVFDDPHERFRDGRSYLVRTGESFSLLKRRGTLFGVANLNQRDIRIVSENASTADYEIRWLWTCKYVLTVDKATDKILAWRYAVTDTKDCVANP